MRPDFLGSGHMNAEAVPVGMEAVTRNAQVRGREAAAVF